MHRRLVSLLMFGTLAALGAVLPEYPKKPITLLVGYAAGSVGDQVARSLAEALKRHLRQPLIVENLPGASGTIGISHALGAKPDGYTLGLGTVGTLTVQPNRTVLSYRGPDTYVPVAKLVTYPNLLIVKSRAPWRTAQDLLRYAQAQPSKVSVGVPGLATVAHLNVAQLALFAKVDFKVVSFDQQVEALVRGHVDAAVAGYAPILPHIKGHQVVALGVFDEHRLPLAQDLPTFKELGFDVTLGSFQGIVAPRGTLAAVVKALDDAISKAVTEPSFVSLAKQTGNTINYKGPEAFAAELRRAFETNGDLIRTLSLTTPLTADYMRGQLSP